MKKMIAVLALLVTTSAFAQTVGDVAFANSGAPAAQDAFLRGLALLHDFEYSDAADSFRAAQKIDPDFAMAYWGEAMTYNHPLWLQQDRDKARAVLAHAPQAKTDREREYLHAVNVLYGDGTKEERDAKYSAEMAAIHQHYPGDVDATAFYALSLLGTRAAHRDYATYMRAAALLEEVFPTHEHHPGVLHYLIHSYDDPIHAPLGIRAARLYGGVAPNAPHALHMTSHIYIALGMWDDVIDANRRAIEVAERRHEMPCGHYPTWLEYAYLQEGRLDDARQMLDRCTAAAMKDPKAAGGAVDMRIQYVTSGGTLPAWSAPEGASAEAKFTLAYSDALAAAQRGDAAALKEASTRLHALQNDLGKGEHSMMMMSASESERPAVIVQQVEALQLAVAGKRDEAIAALRKVASAEQAMPFEFGPPAVEKPGFELLGDQLMAAGRAAEAEKAYRTSLDRTPGRTRSLEGLLAAQKSLGENEEAARTSELLQRYRAKKVAVNQ